MAMILLAGNDAALLEGLAQLLAPLGHATAAVQSLAEARDLAAHAAPLLVVVDRALVPSRADSLGIPLASGGAIVLYRSGSAGEPVVSATLSRSILAELALPLERNRLLALVQRVAERARVVGRGRRNTPPETQAQG